MVAGTASSSADRPPRIPESVADGPTQRFYVVSAALLVQSLKLADVVFSIAEGASDDQDVNWKLLKWVLIDVLLVMMVQWLRVPRLALGWRAVWSLRLLLWSVDWILFGRWEITPSSFLPKSLQALLVTTVSTTETSVRLANLFKPETFLGGQHTIHILATSTAQLDPQAQSFCLFEDHVRPTEPVFVPILVNNTNVASVAYTITDLDDPTRVKTLTASASELKRKAKQKTPHDNLSDEERKLEAWGIVVANPKKQQAVLRHPLPPSSGSGALDVLENLQSTQQVMYLPIREPGFVQIESVTDRDGSPVRIRRIRDKHRPDSFLAARVLRCPRVGFEKAHTHVRICADGAVPSIADIDFVVRGTGPMTVTYTVERPNGAPLKQTAQSIPTTGSKDLVLVPQTLKLPNVGRYTVRLDSVTDGAGNVIQADVHGIMSGFDRSKVIELHSRPTVSFEGACAKGEDVRISERQKANLRLRVSQPSMSNLENPASVVRLRQKDDDGRIVGEQEVKVDKRVWETRLSQPGSWELLSVKGVCDGVVTSPSICTAVLQPRPSLAVSFEPILDACSSEIGVTTSMLFSGSPPFIAVYSVERIGSSSPPQRKTITLHNNREQIRIEPGTGAWRYRFEKIADYHYTEAELPLSPELVFEQRILPVGSARWKTKQKKITVHSCQGNEIPLEVSLEGTAPWELEYTIVGQKPQVIRNIQQPELSFSVPIPPSIASRGGQFAISLVSVKDANGCRKALSLDDLEVDVHRIVPTARFHGAGEDRKSTLLEGEKGRIPVRLAGEGPWILTYEAPPKVPGQKGQQIELEIDNANGEIQLDKPIFGKYKLLSVRDKYCPGTISDADWTFSGLPHPTLRLAESTGAIARNGSVIRAPVCAGRPDSFAVEFDGKPPFQAEYHVLKNGREIARRTIQAIGYRSEEQFMTDDPGHYSFDFAGVSDALYGTARRQGLTAPKGGQDGVVRIEQDVLPLPDAKFAKRAPEHFCVGDTLRSRGKDELQLRLDGKAPFKVDFLVREVGAKKTHSFTQTISGHSAELDLPLKLETATTYEVSIERVVDGHGCEQVGDSLGKDSRVQLNVAEIATITPAISTVDQCVGDYLDFTIQGTPPFTVTYEFDGKRHVVPNSSSQFRRLATSPGEFKIVSVGHKQNRCQSRPVDVLKRVHPVPTARVSNGDAVIVDIHEGDQAEIVFSFVGTPPFSMTYARRRPQDRSKDRTVLETHTVAGIEKNKYSIFTSQEGTWSVDYISDAYCAYPKARIESDVTVHKV